MTATIARVGQVKDTQVMPASKPASFYLSGSTVGATAADAKTTVWRFTPDGKDGVAHDVAGMVVMTGEHGRLSADVCRWAACSHRSRCVCFQGMTSGC
eukprot:COSAG04_NODE_3_length_53939_cov_50.145431_11_plen_98_part_00